MGLARFVMLWIELVPRPDVTSEATGMVVSTEIETPRSLRQILRARVTQLVERLTALVPRRLQQSVRAVERNWTPLFATILLLGLGAFVLWYNVTPNLWLQRTLETVGQLTFIR